MWYPMALPPFLSSPVSLATVWQGTSRSHVSLMHHGILSSQLVVSEYQFNQSPHSDYVTRCYFNLCPQQGSRDDRVTRDVFSFLYVQYIEFCTVR